MSSSLSTIKNQRKIRIVISVLSVVLSLWILNFNDASAAIIGKPPTNLGIVGYWAMNEGTGSYAGDASGNKNTGTLTGGPTFVDGKRGKALNFDGTDDYLSIVDANSLNATNVTLSAWVKTTTAGKYIIAKDPPAYASAEASAGKPDGLITSMPSTLPDSSGAWENPINFLDTIRQVLGEKLYMQGPTITNAYTDPTDVVPGDKMLVSAEVEDPSGVKSVIAAMPHEFGVDMLPLHLTDGDKFNGTWQGIWNVHDTLEKGYTTTVTAENEQGAQYQSQVYWTDPCVPPEVITLDSGTYSAAVGGTFSVTVTSGGGCPTSIQDNTTGSYATVPATDTDLDCNGATCTSSASPFSKTLKCQAAGTYNIRGNYAGLSSSVSTVTCSAAGKTDVPYGLNITSGGKGQIMFMSSGVTYSATSTTSINDNKWHYVLGTYDGTNLKIYIDGALEDTHAGSGNLPIVAGAVRIGADYESTPGNFFNGSIDDAKIYNRALSASEIAAFYKSSAAKFVAPSSNTGLVGYWSFDEGAGTSATDFSGNNNRGVLTNGPTWVDGKRGKALNFDGVDDEVSVNDNNLLDITPNLSISAWIKTADTYGGIVTHVDTASPYAGYELDFGTLGTGCAPSKLAFWSGTAWKCDTGKIVNDNTWHFVSVTVSGTSGIFYIDGIQSTTFTANTIGISTQPLKIGNRTAANDYFNGLIDEVRVYNRALSASEIQALYKSGATKFAPPSNTGLVGYWSFDEGTGSSATDFSGNNNRGVLTNGPTWVAGKRGKALSFDGSNDYVNIGQAVFPTVTGAAASAFAWIKTTKNSANVGVVTQYLGGDPKRFGLTVNNGKISYFMGGTPYDGNAVINDGQWHFVGFTKVVGASDTVVFYVDGVQDTSKSVGTSAYGNYATVIGDHGTTSVAPFNGLIDDVRVYNRALSAAEVQALYNSK